MRFWEGVAKVLGVDREFELVGEASDVEKAVPAIRALNPGVVIVDYWLPGDDGSVLCRRIHDEFPVVRIFVLTRHRAERVVMNSFDVGAHCVASDDCTPTTPTVSSPSPAVVPRSGRFAP